MLRILSIFICVLVASGVFGAENLFKNPSFLNGGKRVAGRGQRRKRALCRRRRHVRHPELQRRLAAQTAAGHAAETRRNLPDVFFT